MTVPAGSPAKARCPKCASCDVKVAFDTAQAVYRLCPACRLGWWEAKHTDDNTDALRCPQCAAEQGIRVRLAYEDRRLAIVGRCGRCRWEWILGGGRLTGTDERPEHSDEDRHRGE